MNGGILRAAEPTSIPTATPTAAASPPPDPIPLAFPRDEGPHRRLSEWWYYTGHLRPEGEQPAQIGFELVVFRAERGDFPVGWASHFAISDPVARTFRYAQRTEIGAQVDRSPADGGFDLSIVGMEGGGGAPDVPWTMRGAAGMDHVTASGGPGAIDLDLATARAPVLHDGDGWIDLDVAGGTYYYSRTRMAISGMYQAATSNAPVRVSGIAWFDHQWRVFIAVGPGGWDWFSVQLDDGRDVMLYVIQSPSGEPFLSYGTIVAPDGSARDLDGADFRVTVLSRWQSPHSGADYPAEWRIELPGENVTLHLVPTLADQELDTRASSGNFYWEGEVSVDGTGADGAPIDGVGYVELTGYAG
jgi:predicted secreted hydrolase